MGAVVLRILALLVIVVVATWGANELKDALNLTMMPASEQQMHRMLILGLVLYVGLLALPFVPGAEVGVAMLTAFGAAIAPLVYAATVIAMMLSYLLGRFLPPQTLSGILKLLRLNRAAAMVDEACRLPREARLAHLMSGAPPRTLGLALRHRYVALALIVNVPGNVVIGGGGGIMMMAGMSGIFTPVPTLFAVLVAVSPIPIAVLLFGA